MPTSGAISIGFAGLLVALLLVDSWNFLLAFYGQSQRYSVLLIRRLDADLGRVIQNLETYLMSAPTENLSDIIQTEVNDITSDLFARPQQRLLGILLRHAAVNFVMTVACFAIVSVNLAVLARSSTSNRRA